MIAADAPILALVPARGGSKQVPRKNIRLFAGQPLIAHTIAAAREARNALRLIVSTDDTEIADVARAAGAEVLMRPAHLAADETPTFPVVQHAVEQLRSADYNPALVLVLQPTSPLRTGGHIDDAIALIETARAESVLSVKPVSQPPLWMKLVTADMRVRSYMEPPPGVSLRRQDLPELHIPNGAIYLTRTRVITEQQRLLGADTAAFIMDERSSIDIDSDLDFEIAEYLFQQSASAHANGR